MGDFRPVADALTHLAERRPLLRPLPEGALQHESQPLPDRKTLTTSPDPLQPRRKKS